MGGSFSKSEIKQRIMNSVRLDELQQTILQNTTRSAVSGNVQSNISFGRGFYQVVGGVAQCLPYIQLTDGSYRWADEVCPVTKIGGDAFFSNSVSYTSNATAGTSLSVNVQQAANISQALQAAIENAVTQDEDISSWITQFEGGPNSRKESSIDTQIENAISASIAQITNVTNMNTALQSLAILQNNTMCMCGDEFPKNFTVKNDVVVDVAAVALLNEVMDAALETKVGQELVAQIQDSVTQKDTEACCDTGLVIVIVVCAVVGLLIFAMMKGKGGGGGGGGDGVHVTVNEVRAEHAATETETQSEQGE